MARWTNQRTLKYAVVEAIVILLVAHLERWFPELKLAPWAMRAQVRQAEAS